MQDGQKQNVLLAYQTLRRKIYLGSQNQRVQSIMKEDKTEQLHSIEMEHLTWQLDQEIESSGWGLKWI